MESIDALRRKAAGLLVVRLGSNMRPPRAAEADAATVEALLRRHPLGGVILFNGRWPETRETLARIQSVAENPLLVMTDMERGLGQQVAGATLFPHLRAFGEIGDEELVEGFARVSAREALACGVHVALAPVADVNRNPDNPIISTRAFGADTAEVARLVAAYVRGARAEGLLTTAKHFPGHGNTSEDSHATLPRVKDDRKEISRDDWPPFRTAFHAGAELVMTAHVSYPALDDSGRPATLSHPILTGVLRGDLGFTGAVISDSLHMEGIKQGGESEGALAVEQIRAGVDMLLDPEDPEEIIEAIAQAVAGGDLDRARLDDALTRAQHLRSALTRRFTARVWTDPASAVPPAEVGSEPHLELASIVAERAVRLEGDFSLGSEGGFLAVMLRSSITPFDPPEQPLAEALRQAFPAVDYRELGPDATDARIDAVLEAGAHARAVLLALVVKPAAWHEFGLPERLERVAREIARHDRVAVVALGDPRALEAFRDAMGRGVTFSDTPVSQIALVKRLAALGQTGPRS